MPFKKMVSHYHIPALGRILTLKESHGHDLKIENQTPIFHVPDVVVNPLGQIGIAAQPMDLRPTGYSWFGIMTSIIVRYIMFKPGDKFGSLRPRPDQAHFSLKHIPELWYFINVPFAHECSDPQPSRIVLDGPTNFAVLLRI